MSLGARMSVDEDESHPPLPHLQHLPSNSHIPLSATSRNSHSRNYSTTSHGLSPQNGVYDNKAAARSGDNEVLFDAFPEEEVRLQLGEDSDDEDARRKDGRKDSWDT